MIKKILISLTIYFLIFSNSFANLQKQESNKKEPLNITSNKVEIIRDKNIIIFTTNVKAVQDKFTLYADRMVVTYKENKEKKVEIQTINATKNVKFIDDKVVATGNDGWYNLLANKIILKNNVKAIQQGIEVTAEEFEYDVITGKTKIIGSKQKNGRVTVILDNTETKK